jgi:penicillin-binding protein 2
VTNALPFWKSWLGIEAVKTQRVRLSDAQTQMLTRQSRYRVANDVVQRVANVLQQPLALDYTNFSRHYEARRALPYPVAKNIEAAHIARFEEQAGTPAGVDLDIQSTRVYPFGTTAAHILGCLQYDDTSKEGEEAEFSYRLPDFRGLVGIEAGFDPQLRGRAGAKSVLVNNLGYRQNETIWAAAAPGDKVVLTLDLKLQQAAEQALLRRVGPQVRGAVVVMDVRSGDLLALVSAPSYNPNHFVQGLPPGEMARLNDPKMRPQRNRATQENFAPGSIFKPLVGLACLEAGLNPNEKIYNPGQIYVGRRRIDDLAPAGEYDFRRAILKSSNTYFITNGLRYGIANIVKLGERLHLGERTGLPTHQETAGIFPSLQRIGGGWAEGDTANICIGQGAVDVTPLQMAVMTAAFANGGKVFTPRLVDRLEPQDLTSGEEPVIFPKAQVRDDLGVSPRNLQILREAMLADTEDPEGTGRAAVQSGLRICGKTGTAQVMDERNRVVDHTTWFISFAPYEQPRYAVVVMVESGDSGGGTCAPIAHDIYAAIQKMEGTGGTKSLAQVK